MLLRPKGVILRQDFTARQSQGPLQFYAMCIMKASGPFLQQTMLRRTHMLISFCFLLFNNILFLFLCTFSVCFQLLQSLLKLVPTTFSLSFLRGTSCAKASLWWTCLDVYLRGCCVQLSGEPETLPSPEQLPIRMLVLEGVSEMVSSSWSISQVRIRRIRQGK